MGLKREGGGGGLNNFLPLKRGGGGGGLLEWGGLNRGFMVNYLYHFNFTCKTSGFYASKDLYLPLLMSDHYSRARVFC